MERIVEPLRAMGVEVAARDGSYAPLTIRGGPVSPVTYELPVASAQVKSCVLFAGLHAEGRTTVIESVPTRDHSERLLRAGRGQRHGGRRPHQPCSGPARLCLPQVAVPGDLSSAAFLAAAAALVPGSELRIERRRVSTRHASASSRSCGAWAGASQWQAEGGEEATGDGPAGEPWGTMVVRHAPLHGTRVAPAEIPSLIDEVPLVALLGTAADGETVVEGAGELRVKESDRLAAIGELLGGLGGTGGVRRLTASGCTPARLTGGAIDSRGDHRLALAGRGRRPRVSAMVSPCTASRRPTSRIPGFERALLEASAG